MPVNVLISAPSHNMIFLPYIYGILKTACDRFPDLRAGVRWMEPIFLSGDPQELLTAYDPLEIDVLGLSCYAWNWALQCEIAARIKCANPGCLIVAGGPHPNRRDRDLLRKHPFLDAVIVQDGEITFRRLLAMVLDSDGQLSDIPGLLIPDADRNIVATGAPELPTGAEDFGESPYQAQGETLRRAVEIMNARGLRKSAVLETNRGCPYHCTYCDWGSATHSRLRRLDTKRVHDDIEWIAANGIEFVFLMDANFGISEGDLDTVKQLCAAHGRFGYPKAVYYSPSKSHAERLLRIAEEFRAAGINAPFTASLQHTRAPVLDALKRKNLPDTDTRWLAGQVTTRGIPFSVQLILGCPGDTYQLWQGCMTDLMEWGFHGGYHVFNFDLLPNTPADDPVYKRLWQIETIAITEAGMRATDVGSSLVVSTRTFTRQHWRDMWVFTHLVTALHALGMTRYISQFLRGRYDVSFHRFYSRIADELGLDEASVLGGAAGYLKSKLQAFLDGKGPLGDSAFRDRWLFLRLCTKKSRFYEEIETFVSECFPEVDTAMLADLMHFQQNVLVDYDYSPVTGRRFQTEYDWIGYFADGLWNCGQEPSSGPRYYSIEVSRIGTYRDVQIDWHQLIGSIRLTRWINLVAPGMLHRNDQSLFALDQITGGGAPVTVATP